MIIPLFSQDVLIKAWNFASVAHKKQLLPGSDIPYLNHIGSVAMEIMAAISEVPVPFPDLSVQCALLHDVIEDTDVTFDQVESEFGTHVASGVLSLTKDKTIATKQGQMLDSLERIKQQPREVWMVKLADRITNLQPPPHDWNRDKIAGYRNEAELIFDHLGEAHTVLAERLKQKIRDYLNYLE